MLVKTLRWRFNSYKNEIILEEDCQINEVCQRMYFKLGIGERSILSIALKYKEEYKEYYCIIYDKATRSVAEILIK